MKSLNSILGIVLFSTSVWAGGVVGNGGDVVRCAGSNSWVSLDYLLTADLFGPATKVKPIFNLDKSILRISMIIKTKLPHLYDSFNMYIADLKNHTDTKRNYIWTPAFFELEEIHDESVDRFPVSCRLPGMGSAEVKQIVIRKEWVRSDSMSNFVQFRYDQQLFEAVGPLQKSFILVHEWLWDLSKDVAVNRKINYFLHSDIIDRMSKEQVAEQIQKLGL